LETRASKFKVIAIATSKKKLTKEKRCLNRGMEGDSKGKRRSFYFPGDKIRKCGFRGLRDIKKFRRTIARETNGGGQSASWIFKQKPQVQRIRKFKKTMFCQGHTLRRKNLAGGFCFLSSFSYFERLSRQHKARTPPEEPAKFGRYDKNE